MWHAGVGLFAWARATGDAERVQPGTSVPWPQPEGYKYVFPIEVVADEPVPVMSSWKGLDELAGLGRVPAPQFPPAADGRVSDVQGLFSPSGDTRRSLL